MSSKAIIIILILSYAIFFLFMPVFQIPDEPDHYEYVYWIANNKYPYLPKLKTSQSNQYISGLVKYYRFDKITVNPNIIPNHQVLKNTGYSKTSPDKKLDAISFQASQPPIYYLVASIFYRLGTVFRLNAAALFYLTRLTSAVFYFLSLFVCFRIFQILFKNNFISRNLLLFVGLNPIMLKMASGINPDIGLLFFCLLFLYLIIKNTNLYYIAFISALATLTKFSGFFTVFVFIGLVFGQKINLIDKLKKVLKYLIVYGLLISPWLLINYFRYHKFLIDNFHLIGFHNEPEYSFIGALFAAGFELRHAFMQYAGFIGWGTPHPFKWFFAAYSVVFIFLFIIGLADLFKAKVKHKLIVIGYIFSMLFFLFIVALDYKLNQYGFDIQGRYLLPAFPAITVVIFYAVKKVTKLSSVNASKLICYWSLFHYYFILFWVLIPRYYV